MVQNKKKVSLWFIVLGAVLCAYAGYLLNGAWEPGMEMNGLFHFQQVYDLYAVSVVP